MDMADYAKIRKERRAAITALKRHRRLAVGPFATFHFECFETMWMQVHEMLHIEQGGEEQIAGELEAYNPLIPRGDALIATLMLEIDDPERRERELYRLAGIEDTVRLEVGDFCRRRAADRGRGRAHDRGRQDLLHPFPPLPLLAGGGRGVSHAGRTRPAGALVTRHTDTSPSCRKRRAPPWPKTWTTARAERRPRSSAFREPAAGSPRGRSPASSLSRRRARHGTSRPRSRAGPR